MFLQVVYRRDLSESAGAPAARRWSEKIETDDPTSALPQLTAAARAQGHEILRVVIDGQGLT